MLTEISCLLVIQTLHTPADIAKLLVHLIPGLRLRAPTSPRYIVRPAHLVSIYANVGLRRQRGCIRKTGPRSIQFLSPLGNLQSNSVPFVGENRRDISVVWRILSLRACNGEDLEINSRNQTEARVFVSGRVGRWPRATR